MAQSVKSVANLFSDSKSYSLSTVKAKNTGTDFSSIMNSNLKSKSTAKNQEISVKEKLSDSAKEGINKDNLQNGRTNEKQTENPAEDEVKVKNTANTVDSVNEQSKEKIDRDDSSFYAYIQNYLTSLQDTVKDSLNITQEDLEKAMESLGFTAADLLNPDNLKALVLQVNGNTDITEALTDEKLANTIKDLLQAVEDFKAEQDVTISPEELKEMLKDYLSAGENQVNNDVSNNQAPVVSDQSVQKGNKDVTEADNSKVDTGKNNISLEVYKTSESSESESLESNVSDNKDNNQADVKMSSPIDLLIQDLAMKGNENTMSFTEQIAYVRQMEDITNQIVEQIKVTIKPDQTSMELQLNPESLGKINLSVVSKDGVMTAKFTTENEVVKEAIENQLHILKDSLNNQGIKVETIEVTVSNFSFDQSNQASGGNEQGRQNSSRNRNIIKDETEVYTNSNTEEALTYASLDQNESRIDYTA